MSRGRARGSRTCGDRARGRSPRSGGAASSKRRRAWTVTLTPQAEADRDALDDDARAQINRALRTRTAVNPRAFGAVDMYDAHGAWAGFWKIRVGLYRVTYQINDPRDVLVIDIGTVGIYGRRR